MDGPRPEDMRTAMAEYIAGVHEAYAAVAVLQPPAVQGRLPLVREPFTVVAAGARNLHVIATAQTLAPPRGQEVETTHRIDGMRWTVRFLDPVVLPALGTIDESAEAQFAEVRRVIGIGAHHYHLVVQPGASLTGHHATHAGTGLANAHLAAERDYEAIRAHAPRQEALIDELAAADAAGLTIAHGLLARELIKSEPAIEEAGGDRAAVRRAILTMLRDRP